MSRSDLVPTHADTCVSVNRDGVLLEWEEAMTQGELAALEEVPSEPGKGFALYYDPTDPLVIWDVGGQAWSVGQANGKRWKIRHFNLDRMPDGRLRGNT